MKEIRNILVTGSCGQIGSELTNELRERYGNKNVIATDILPSQSIEPGSTELYHSVNVIDIIALEKIIADYNIDTIFHMAAILSANGEKNPQHCWNVNMNGTINILELGVKYDMTRIIIPSSIAVWGNGVQIENTPQDSILQPTSMYGVTKVCGELISDYYVQRFGLDVRGLRYPGIISHQTLPGGGTTDYAVSIYYDAIDRGEYTCFVKEDTRLPMMYMPDTINGTIKLAEAELSKLKHHSNFNLNSMSFDVSELAESINKYIPEFKCYYKPDYRQEIAESWPNSIDDTCAREEWGWKPEWDLDSMTRDMLEHLGQRKELGNLF